MDMEALFPTLLYRAPLGPAGLRHALESRALELALTDRAGQRWCARHGYRGYTSYGSLPDLFEREPAFARLAREVARHAARFARALHWDLRGGMPICDSMWVNVMGEGGAHGGHIHTNAVLSGTYYVAVPEGAGAISFEDPRYPFMMAAPPRKPNAPRAFSSEVSVRPAAGTLLLWESWLRHEVATSRTDEPRISVSFNLVIGSPG
jgi:uncharacterized protein (TIGR02466 family)